MRLLRVELTRFRVRRAIAVTLLVAAALTALLAGSTIYESRPADATEQAAAEQLLARDLAAFEGELEACREDPDAYLGEQGVAEDCENIGPRLDWYLSRPPLDLAAESRDTGRVVLVLMAAVAIVAGATFVGADFSSGSMRNQLLFRPRRTAVWLAKAVAVTVAVTVAAAVAVAAFWTALALAAASRGIVTEAATWEDIGRTAARGLALVAGVALGSFALTTLLRSTVGTLGLLLGYAVVGEGLAASLPFARMSQWSLARNVDAWLNGGAEVYDETICRNSTSGCDPTYLLSAGHAATYFGVLLVLAVVVSVLTFRRRDVT